MPHRTRREKRNLTGRSTVKSLGKAIFERRRPEEQFRLVVEHSPSGMLMVDQAGTIRLVNTQLEKEFGYSRQELLGQSVELLIPKRFRPAPGTVPSPTADVPTARTT